MSDQLCVKYHYCLSKVMELSCGSVTKSELHLDLWPIDAKIKRGSPWVMINSCIKCHHCMSKDNGVVMRKRFKLQSTNLTLTFDPYTPKSIRVVIRSSAIHAWSIIIIGQKETELSCENHFFIRQTDIQTWWNQLTPLPHIQVLWRGYESNKRIVIKNKICFSQYIFFLEKNSHEKQICFSQHPFFYKTIETKNVLLICYNNLLLICFEKLIICYIKLIKR